MTIVNNCTCESCCREPEFPSLLLRGLLCGGFLGGARESSPSQEGSRDRHRAGGLEDGQAFPDSGEFLFSQKFWVSKALAELFLPSLLKVGLSQSQLTIP